MKKYLCTNIITDTFADFQTICVGHIDIKQNNVRMPFHLFQRFDTINGRQNQETFEVEEAIEIEN